MARLLHFFAVLVLVVTGALVGTAIAWRVWLATGQGQRWAAAELGRRLGVDLAFRHLGGPLPFGVDIDELRAGAVRVPRLSVRWSLRDWIDGTARLRAKLSGLDVRGPEGVWRLDGGELKLYGPRDALDLEGALDHGRVIVTGHGSFPDHRGDLQLVFRDLAPPLLASAERMVLSGRGQVSLRGRMARFTAGGRYHHRRQDGATATLGGSWQGSGVVRLSQRPTGRFTLRVRDRGHASKLVAPEAPPSELVIRGRLGNRLELHVEGR